MISTSCGRTRARKILKARKSGYVLYGLAAIAVIAALFFLVKGCAVMPWNHSGQGMQIRVTVTRHFGKELLRDKTVAVRDAGSAMDALLQAAEVETSYGGGFIHAIDGLASGYAGIDAEKTDWFYYVNGQMADTGAAEFEVREGDWLVFDYHSWEHSVFSPALAGCFPEPFIHGYREEPRSCTVLFASEVWEKDCRELGALLHERGAPSCSVQGLEPRWRPREGDYAIVVGTASELEGNDFLSEAFDNYARLGMYAFFDGGEMVILDPSGEESSRIFSGAGLVQAMGSRLGEDDTALLVTGTDERGVKAALALLFEPADGGSRPVMVMATRADVGEIEIPAR
jgi:hypothetical protein